MLRKNDVYTCPGCSTVLRVRGTASYLLVCPSCGKETANKSSNIQHSVMPEDWSVVQLGTTGLYKEKAFEVIGRIRLQFRNDYKNFWCVWYDASNQYGWLAESFGEYILCENIFIDMDNREDLSRFRAGDKFVLHNDTTVVTDYIDKCEWISLEGELCHWPNYQRGFLSVQAQNNEGIAAYFNLVRDEKGKFLVGQMVKFSDLNLKSIREWDEWK